MNSSQFEAGLVGTAAVTHTYSHTLTHTSVVLKIQPSITRRTALACPPHGC